MFISFKMFLNSVPHCIYYLPPTLVATVGLLLVRVVELQPSVSLNALCDFLAKFDFSLEAIAADVPSDPNWSTSPHQIPEAPVDFLYCTFASFCYHT